MLEDLQHYCGVGAINDPRKLRSVGDHIAPLLEQLEHRGSGASGVAYIDRETGAMEKKHESGRASTTMKKWTANTNSAIFHTLYRTNPASQPHPQIVEHAGRRIAVAFNGNIPPTRLEGDARKFLDQHGLPCETVSDTELIANLIAYHLGDTRGSMEKTFRRLPDHLNDGAYTIATLQEDGHIHAFRDPRGFHPLSLGQTDEGVHVLSSEDAALKHRWDQARQIGISTVQPGSMVHLGPGVIRPEIEELFRPNRAHCAFEWAYFAKRLSTLDDVEVRRARTMFGEILAELDHEDMKHWPSPVIVAVPDSARIAAEGYHDKSRIPRADALVVRTQKDTNEPVQPPRSFTAHENRAEIVRKKFIFDVSLIAGKDVVLLDDSLVRGTTMKELLILLRQQSPTSRFHVRFAYPPVTAPCFYGIDFATKNQLLVPKFSHSQSPTDDVLSSDVLDAIAREIGADSVKFLPISGVHRAIGMPSKELCRACFTGEYPTTGGQELYQLQMNPT